MLRAMTKPAFMTFSNIEAINFYFNAKLTDFAMFSYELNIQLRYTHPNFQRPLNSSGDIS